MLAGLVGDISAKITEAASDSSDGTARGATRTPGAGSTAEMFSPLMKIAQNVSSAAEFVSTAAQQRVASEFQSFESEATRAGATDALQEIERLKQLHGASGTDDPAARRLQFSIDDDAAQSNASRAAAATSADAEFAAEDAAELRQMVNELQEELRAHKSKTVRQALAQSDQHRREKRELEEQLQRACVALRHDPTRARANREQAIAPAAVGSRPSPPQRRWPRP